MMEKPGVGSQPRNGRDRVGVFSSRIAIPEEISGLAARVDRRRL